MKRLILAALTLALCLNIFIISANVADSNSEGITVNEGIVNYPENYSTNIQNYHAVTLGAMPCIGESKVLVFYIDIPGEDPVWTKSTVEIEKMFFDEELKNETGTIHDSNGDYLVYSDSDSLRSFYYRSSYGKVDITGDVYEYTKGT